MGRAPENVQQSRNEDNIAEESLVEGNGKPLTRRILRPDLPRNFFSIAADLVPLDPRTSSSALSRHPEETTPVDRVFAAAGRGRENSPGLIFGRAPLLSALTVRLWMPRRRSGSMRTPRRHATKYRSGAPRFPIYDSDRRGPDAARSSPRARSARAATPVAAIARDAERLPEPGDRRNGVLEAFNPCGDGD